jgi:hypothetical protein
VKTRFFKGLSPSTFSYGFTEFKMTAWKTPVPISMRSAAAPKKHLGISLNDCSYANSRFLFQLVAYPIRHILSHLSINAHVSVGGIDPPLYTTKVV